MSKIIIPATKSITVSSKFPNRSFKKKTITIGFKKKYICNSCLFFDIGFIESACVKSAMLTLFKTSVFFFISGIEFYIAPLLSPFSSTSTYYDCQNFDEKLAVKFSPFLREVTVQIDMTTIVNKWLDNTLPNYGLVIIGRRMNLKESGCVSFGSAYNSDNTLIPIIDIDYKPNIFCLLPPPPSLRYTTNLIQPNR